MEGAVASSKDAFALAVLVGVLCCDLSLAGGVGQGEHQRLLNMLAHLLYHFLYNRDQMMDLSVGLERGWQRGRRGASCKHNMHCCIAM